MKYTEIQNLTKHYEKVLSDSVQEIEKLKREIEESKAAIVEAKKKAREAAKVADTETYLREKNIQNMHEQRISMHEVKIIDLKYKHLIDSEEFNRINRELIELQNELTNEHADKFMQLFEEMRKVASEQERQMSACDRFGSFVQEKVYRKLGKETDDSSIEHRHAYGFNGFRRIVKLLDEPNHDWSVDMHFIKGAAAKVLKARTLKSLGGMDQKADSIMKS